MFEEMAVLVDAQGEMLDAIEAFGPVSSLGVPSDLKSHCTGSREQHKGVHCASRAGPASKSWLPKVGIDFRSSLGVDQDPESTDAGTAGALELYFFFFLLFLLLLVVVVAARVAGVVGLLVVGWCSVIVIIALVAAVSHSYHRCRCHRRQHQS